MKITLFSRITPWLVFLAIQSNNVQATQLRAKLNLRFQSPQPKLPPVPTLRTLETTAELCNYAKNALFNCFSANMAADQGDSCMSCVADTLPINNATSCLEIEQGFCQAIGSCADCNLCSYEYGIFADCVVAASTNNECGVQCEQQQAARMTTSPVVPTTADKCNQVKDALFTCFSTELAADQGASCMQCVADSIPQNNATSCTEIEGGFCGAIASCAECGSCAVPYGAFADCVVSSSTYSKCTINCEQEQVARAPQMFTMPPVLTKPLVMTTAEKCNHVKDALFTCFSTNPMSDRGASCMNCIADKIPVNNASSCTEIEDGFCSAIESCDCGLCNYEYGAFADCVVASSTDGECGIHCQQQQQQFQGPDTPFSSAVQWSDIAAELKMSPSEETSSSGRLYSCQTFVWTMAIVAICSLLAYD